MGFVAVRYYLNSSLWNKPMEPTEAEISTLSGRPVALPAQHHLPVVLYGHTQHLPSARGNWVTPEAAPGLSSRLKSVDRRRAGLQTHLWVYICVNKNVSSKSDKLAVLVLGFSFPFQGANETTLLIALLFPSMLALSIYCVLCGRTWTSSLYLICCNLNLRKEKRQI